VIATLDSLKGEKIKVWIEIAVEVLVVCLEALFLALSVLVLNGYIYRYLQLRQDKKRP